MARSVAGRWTRLVLAVAGAALATVGVALAAPAGARADAYVLMQYGLDGKFRVTYSGEGPSQDVTVNMIGQGVPALTGDSPGAQEIDITDTADTFKGYQATPPVPDAGCVIVSAHEARCYASRSEQLGWRASHCNFPPGCTGPGPSGLLDMFVASLSGQRTNYQDTPGSTPIQQSVSTFGSGQVSLWNGGQNTLYLGGPYQSGVLRPGSGPTSASTGSG
ncbi:MAG TPA: hypothetical protein VGY97_11520, partial [Solirubrobacteraceae bacterium]|nr:hypothetical protein [Solirubrobacteraceae bacterium]